MIQSVDAQLNRRNGAVLNRSKCRRNFRKTYIGNVTLNRVSGVHVCRRGDPVPRRTSRKIVQQKPRLVISSNRMMNALEGDPIPLHFESVKESSAQQSTSQQNKNDSSLDDTLCDEGNLSGAFQFYL